MTATQEDGAATACNQRQFRSPNRILARSFRLARDKWKQKYMKVRAELKSARQLATERGTSRDRWRAECDSANHRAIQAEALAQQRLDELMQLRSEQQELKKKARIQQAVLIWNTLRQREAPRRWELFSRASSSLLVRTSPCDRCPACSAFCTARWNRIP